MTDWKVFGHGKTKSFLDKQLAEDHLAQAYLFLGPSGVGKKTLAIEWAERILQNSNLAAHPDFMLLDAGDAEITMALAQDFINRLSLKPFVAKRKVAIINNAENLNPQSSNALLKTLEEPSLSAVIILIGSGRRILPTIVSRCQTLRFGSFSSSELKDFAALKGWQVEVEILTLAFGSPARLTKFAENPEFFSEQKHELNNLRQLTQQTFGEKLASVSALAEQEDSDLRSKLLLWLNWQTAELSNKPEQFNKSRALLEALRGLDQNKNKKLLLQSLMLKI
jgi:DNA polymerase-3 subunit delta'